MRRLNENLFFILFDPSSAQIKNKVLKIAALAVKAAFVPSS
jgi:hypothetical protein